MEGTLSCGLLSSRIGPLPMELGENVQSMGVKGEEGRGDPFLKQVVCKAPVVAREEVMRSNLHVV